MDPSRGSGDNRRAHPLSIRRRDLVPEYPRWTKRVLYVALALAAFAVLSYLVTSSVASDRLDEAIAAIRSRKEPVSLLEIAPPAVEETANAAVPLMKLGEVLIDPDEATLDARRRFESEPFASPDADVAPLRTWCEANAAAFGLVEDAIARPSSRFDVDYEDPLVSTAPPFQPFIEAGHLLIVRALIAARNGKVDDAFGDVERALRLAEKAGPEPTLMAIFVRFAIEHQAIECLATLLPHGAPSAEQLARLASRLEATRVQDGFHRALLGERCFGHYVFAASE